MIVDAHVHLGGPPPEAEPDKFMALMRKSRINKAVVFRYVYGKATAVGNRLIRSAVEKYPEELIGFAWLNPAEKQATREMRTAVRDWNFKGIKLHLELGPGPAGRVKEIFGEAQRLSVPICIHLGEDFDLLEELCAGHEVRVIVAHLGTGVYNLDMSRLKRAVALAERHENIYLETSATTFFFIEYAVRHLGPARIIFGSDFPHEHPLVMVRAIELLDLGQRDKDLILGENLIRLVGL